MSKEFGTVGILVTFLGAFLILMAGMTVGAVIHQSSPQSSPQSFTNETLTVSEKYPIYGYETTCGKGYHCNQYTMPKVVDESGRLWTFQDERVWARVKVNHTYVVQYAYYINARQGQVIEVIEEVK